MRIAPPYPARRQMRDGRWLGIVYEDGVARDGRRPPRGEPKLHRPGPVDVGQQSVRMTSDRARTPGRDPSQPCFTIGHALSLRGRAASSAGTVASSL